MNDLEEMWRHVQTDRLMCLGTTLASVEEVLLDVVQDGEPGAARFVANSGTVGACRPLVLHHGS